MSGSLASRRGVSLIEAVVALLIMGLAMPPMLQALGQAHEDRVEPVQASRARWLAIERMEELLADRASPARGYGYLVEANYPDEVQVVGFDGFARSVTIEESAPDLGPGTGAKAVTVRVSWSRRSGADAAVEMTTLVAELP